MQALGHELRGAGHCPRYFSYFPWAERYDQVLARLERQLEAYRRGTAPFALIGHSLGGLLLRHALANGTGRNPAQLIMLGAPNHSPRVARLAWRLHPFRWLTRSCGRVLTDEALFDRLPLPDYPHTVVAGTRGMYGRWSPFGEEPNDGLLAVSEAGLGLEGNMVRVAAGHTFMMNYREVRWVIRRILEEAAGGDG